MYKLMFFSLILILTACNSNEVVGLSNNNEVKKTIISEFSKMNIGGDFKLFSKSGEIKKIENTDIVDNCLYAESKDGDVDYLVFSNKISTATYLNSVFLGINSSELKSKINDLSLIRSEYDEATYYLQYDLDERYGVKFYLVDDKVIEVTYGLLDKLQYQEGCS
ncbi:hypothetical protein [Acinetobacter indicus]|uniref:hypothetical protein n=1 Tax=Acinetobacter indicus TaxID=756892 RepID=UPI000CECB7BF|nr:hypothetical protein [Acinetobacter indicus]